ncbi:hypothetical protein DPMN_001980 [Dreissena polymorpha]|uniref:Uncharacterized protein n=1 Tax=Dreissena polymorpha TaxID=45954 RepID=A0A9D4MMR2_DREPO|nr:hypothetical protein DPMN_001980 [Dreissena polymorpha]
MKHLPVRPRTSLMRAQRVTKSLRVLHHRHRRRSYLHRRLHIRHVRKLFKCLGNIIHRTCSTCRSNRLFHPVTVSRLHLHIQPEIQWRRQIRG